MKQEEGAVGIHFHPGPFPTYTPHATRFWYRPLILPALEHRWIPHHLCAPSWAIRFPGGEDPFLESESVIS